MTRPTDCSQHEHHKPPSGMLRRGVWAVDMAKTHDQVFCDECERWAIWRPKVRVGD